MLQLPALYKGAHRVSADRARLVGDLQKFFLGLDYQIVVDEDFGPKTEQAVQKYQKSKSIAADGLVGPTTWGCLLADGFRPSSYQAEEQGCNTDQYGPPKPPGSTSPNGLLLFGNGFQYEPKPLPYLPEYIQPDPAWVRNNIASKEIPQLVGVEGASALITFNRALMGQLVELFEMWERLGLMHYVLTWSGSWVPRFIRGSRTKLSNHAFGSAFDINAAWNGFRKQPALRNQRGTVRPLVETAYSLGFYWGGWYNDGMHFEAYKVMTSEEMAKLRQGAKIV